MRTAAEVVCCLLRREHIDAVEIFILGSSYRKYLCGERKFKSPRRLADWRLEFVRGEVQVRSRTERKLPPLKEETAAYEEVASKQT